MESIANEAQDRGEASSGSTEGNNVVIQIAPREEEASTMVSSSENMLVRKRKVNDLNSDAEISDESLHAEKKVNLNQYRLTFPSSEDWVAPTSIDGIETRVNQLLQRVPSFEDTAALRPHMTKEIESWCRDMKQLVRHFNLLTHFIRPATYKWSTELTGSKSQNIADLKTAASRCSSMLDVVSGTCTNIIQPSLMSRLVETRTTEDTQGVKIKRQLYKNQISDPEQVLLDRFQLCDESLDKRELVVCALKLMIQNLKDYKKATANEDFNGGGMMM